MREVSRFYRKVLASEIIANFRNPAFRRYRFSLKEKYQIIKYRATTKKFVDHIQNVNFNRFLAKYNNLLYLHGG